MRTRRGDPCGRPLKIEMYFQVFVKRRIIIIWGSVILLCKITGRPQGPSLRARLYQYDKMKTKFCNRP